MTLADCDGGPAVAQKIYTLVFERLSDSDVMESIMSTMGKEVSRRARTATTCTIQCSC
jgi:hypothetical protein